MGADHGSTHRDGGGDPPALRREGANVDMEMTVYQVVTISRFLVCENY